jgi:hypothetical protein
MGPAHGASLLHFLTGRGGLLRLCGGDGKGGNSGSGSDKFQVHTFSSMLLLERQRLMSSAVVPRKFLGHCMMMLRHDREPILPHSSCRIHISNSHGELFSRHGAS